MIDGYEITSYVVPTPHKLGKNRYTIKLVTLLKHAGIKFAKIILLNPSTTI